MTELRWRARLLALEMLLAICRKVVPEQATVFRKCLAKLRRDLERS